MIIWTNKIELLITSSCEPKTTVLKPLPTDTELERVSKELYPYINKKDVIFHIEYLGERFTISIPKGFRWNGTNCIGLQHHPNLLNASMVHDFLCNYHNKIGNDRQLSSIIFRELGLSSGVNKAFMWVAYYAVDVFQKYFGKDINNNKWEN